MSEAGRPCFDNALVQFIHKYGFVCLAPIGLLIAGLTWWLVDLNERMKQGETQIRIMLQDIAAGKVADEQMMLRLGQVDHTIDLMYDRFLKYYLETREKREGEK